MKHSEIKGIVSTLLFCLAYLAPASVSAEVVPGTPFSIHFESGNVVGSGRNIIMHRVPVINVDTNQTTLYDLTFRFTFNPTDGAIFEQISSVTPSQPVPVTNITPGIYKTQRNVCYALEGPSMIDANRNLYTIRGVNAESSSVCTVSTDNLTTSVVSGPAVGHPDIGNREIAPSLVDNYVYGVISGNASFAPFSGWQQNEIIGLRQSGEQLIIGLFSDDTSDFRDPLETAILTKVTK